jgi:L-threonylcarbamoyladenylate synthase
MAEIGKDINKAKVLLQEGKLVAIPTETVYGLAANALNVSAVSRIFEVKKRPYFDPLIVHIRDIGAATLYAENVPAAAVALAEKFWPGPLTLLVKKKLIVPDLTTSGLDTVALRCPDHPLTTELLRQLDFPLAAPSANPFGYVSPTKASHVSEQLGSEIDYILDGGDCEVGIESTIVGFENNSPVVFRIGGLSIEMIEDVVGPTVVRDHSTSDPKAPGQLKSHYAPHVRVVIGDLEQLLQQFNPHSTGLLSFRKDFNSPYQFVLSPSGSLKEAAQNLFTALRGFDKMPIDVILAELVPDTGLGKAINDRLKRAAANES